MASIDPQLLLSHKFPEMTYKYSDRDVALYNLGVGACAHDAVDSDELKYVYHEKGQEFIQVLPTFAALLSLGAIPIGRKLPGLQFDERLLLHGQQYIELYKPLPSNATLRSTITVAGLHDKGKAAILEIETKSFDEASGELLCMNRNTAFLRGAGGFSKSSQPYSYSNYLPTLNPSIKIPKDQPLCDFEDQTQQSQAVLYRLSGDYNPLHSDPKVATVAGFSRPILHGLCTLGFAVRAIIKTICRGESQEHIRAFPFTCLPRRDFGHRNVARWLEGYIPNEGEREEPSRGVGLCGSSPSRIIIAIKYVEIIL